MTDEHLSNIVKGISLEGNFVTLTVHKQIIHNLAVFMHSAVPGTPDALASYSETLQVMIAVNEALIRGEEQQLQELASANKPVEGGSEEEKTEEVKDEVVEEVYAPETVEGAVDVAVSE